MMRLLLTLALLLWATTAQAQVVLVNATASAQGTLNYNPTMSLTVPATTVGNLIVLAVSYTTEARTVSSTSCGATFTELEAATSTDAARVLAGIATSSVTTCSVTLSANSVGPDSLTMFEFSGAADPLNEGGTSALANNGSGTAHNVGSVTPDVANSVFVAVALLSGTSGGWTVDADFTNGFTPSIHYAGYRIQTGSAASADWTSTTVNSRTSAVVLVNIDGVVSGVGCTGGLTLLGAGKCDE